MIQRLCCLLLVLTSWTGMGWVNDARAGQSVTVFAAASLKNAMDDIANLYQQSNQVRISLSYGGSSALARQIQYGAPAQIFLSANATWMDMLQSEGMVAPDARVNLLTNQLVLISGSQNDTSLVIEPEMDLITALRGGRMAMALVDAVPAGIYGRAALQTLGVWDDVQPHVAQTDNVRAALRLVALGEAALGIVYATDAATEPGVRVLGVFPEASHPPILYPAARLTLDDSAASRAFFLFLTGPQARDIFERHGFGVPGAEGP